MKPKDGGSGWQPGPIQVFGHDTVACYDLDTDPREQAPLDPELEQKLQALGYLE